MKSRALWIVALLALTGCQSVPQFRSYRPNGEERNLGIEVLQHSAMPVRYELRIDGEFVAEMKSTLDYHPRASGTFKGRKVEMRGDFLIARGFVVEVFVDGERAANFTFF